MSRKRRKQRAGAVAKKPTEGEVLEAELVDLLPAPAPPPNLTSEQIAAAAADRRLQLQAWVDTIQTLTPEERYDAITTMTDEIQSQLQLRILQRLAWLDSPHRELRDEATDFIIRAQNASNEIKKTNVQLYEALGLNERKGFVGGKEVPRLLPPAMDDQKWKEKFGPPQGSA